MPLPPQTSTIIASFNTIMDFSFSHPIALARISKTTWGLATKNKRESLSLFLLELHPRLELMVRELGLRSAQPPCFPADTARVCTSHLASEDGPLSSLKHDTSVHNPKSVFRAIPLAVGTGRCERAFTD